MPANVITLDFVLTYFYFSIVVVPTCPRMSPFTIFYISKLKKITALYCPPTRSIGITKYRSPRGTGLPEKTAKATACPAHQSYPRYWWVHSKSNAESATLHMSLICHLRCDYTQWSRWLILNNAWRMIGNEPYRTARMIWKGMVRRWGQSQWIVVNTAV